jgi:hypothetical protein
MRDHRDVAENNRQAMFKTCFIEDQGSKGNKSDYLKQLKKDLSEEIEIYQTFQDEIIKKFKKFDAIWTQSSIHWLGDQEVSARKTIEFALSSPLTFNGEQSSQDIFKLY